MSDTPLPWYALTVRPQHELAASRALAARDIEAYVPLYKSRRRWSDRVHVTEFPLLPGYVLCRFRREDRTSVLRAHGVRTVVQFGPEPAVIPEIEVESIRTVLASGFPVEPWDRLVPGQKVRIERGPLAGAEGVFLRHGSRECLAVSIPILGRSAVTMVDREAVTPYAAAAGA